MRADRLPTMRTAMDDGDPKQGLPDSVMGSLRVSTKLFDHEIAIDEADLLDRIRSQYADMAAGPLSLFAAGTDNRMYRLGTEYLVRVPRTPSASVQLRKELHWLPRIASAVPSKVPVVHGAVTMDGSPLPVAALYRWIDGTPGSAALEALDTPENARRLADWIAALRAIPAADGPRPGAHNFNRGEPLHKRDKRIAGLIRRHASRFDETLARRIWSEALESVCDEADVRWHHGDLQPSNVLLQGGRMDAVIDFGGLGVGDPSVDLLPCWTVFGPRARAVMFEALGSDGAAWRRGRGWALATALKAYDYYRGKSPGMVRQSLRTLDAVLS